MKTMVEEHNVDLSDPSVQNEFKRMQEQNLIDVRMLKEGKKPPTQEELDANLAAEREKEYNERLEKLKQEEAHQAAKSKEMIERAHKSAQ